MAEMEKKQQQQPIHQERPSNSIIGSSTVTARPAMPQINRPTSRPSMKGRESSWGFVDVLQMLDLEDDLNPEEQAVPPPPMPKKDRSFAVSPQARTILLQ
jgi:hypothetical protein